MIFLHVLFFSICIPALFASDRSQAISRINEARARILSNRAKLRATSPGFTNHGRPSITNRSKRQYGPVYASEPYPYAPPPPPPPTVNENIAYESQPELIHICSLEDDHYARSAESQEELQDFHDFAGDIDKNFPASPTSSSIPRTRANIPRMSQPENPHSENLPKAREDLSEDEHFEHHGVARTMNNQWLDESQAERPLNRALEELSDVREILSRFEGDGLREAEAADVAREDSSFPQEPIVVPSPKSPTPNGTGGQRVVESYHSGPEQPAKTNKTGPREADAHVHSRYHSHHHSVVHGRGQPISPAYVTNPAFHVPQTQVVTPGLNVNINQNQNVHSGLSPSVHQPGIHQTPFLNRGLAPSISHFLPSQSAIISTQTQPGFHVRHSGLSFDGRDADLDSHRAQSFPVNNFNSHFRNQKVNQNFHPNAPQNFGQKIPSFSPNRPVSRPRSADSGLVNQGDHHVSFIPREETLGATEDETNIENEERDAFSTEEDMSTWSDLKEASPTHKKKKMKKMQQPYYQSYPSYGSYYQGYSPSYGRYREAREEKDGSLSEDLFATSSERREASPTHHKEKNKKSQHYSRYREAEENEDFVSSPVEDREANPTHKKKQKFTTVYYPVYNKQPGYQSGHYREADENEDGTVNEVSAFSSAENREADDNEDGTVNSELAFSSSETREAAPTHHKKKKFKPIYSPQPQYYPQSGHYREAEENGEQRRQGDNDLEDVMSSRFLFNFPARSEYKRSTGEELDEILGQQRQIVDSLQKQSKNDEDFKLIADITNRTLTDVEEKRKKMTKRSIPLTRLISDPKVKLDVPQTVENFGTATKNAFEDERAPMYHLKHLIGSSKNAVLSAMRIPPQNMIIPSEYEIVRSSERVGNARRDDNDDEDPFFHTFKRVGQMVRNSIRSGQDTAAHIGEAAYSAKNVLNTARHSVPRLIMPYSQIPAIHDTRRRRPSKAILITPRILDLAEETSARRSSESRPNLVRLGHLMDAVGISKPNAKNLELQKIIFEPRGISEARVDERLAHLYSKFRNNYNDDVDTVSEAISTLEDAKISVGAKDLRDFLVKMRGELTHMVNGTPSEYKKKKPIHKKKMKKQQETKEMGRFIETLFDGSAEQPKNGETTIEPKKGDGENNIVGDRMFLSPELLHPFMGRVSETDLKNFLRDNGDEKLDKLPNTLEHQREDASKNLYGELTGSSHDEHNDNSDLGYVLGAINPLMFERLYNQTVKVNKDGVTDPKELFRHQQKGEESEGNGTVGASFVLPGPMLKPFMGEVQPQQVETILNTYNRDEE